jgi:hypothetical protein
LDDEVRAPYETVAAAEKKKYDEAVAEWRIKESAKKKAHAAVKKEGSDERRAAVPMREPMVPNLFSSERSLGSFSDSSNPYPSEWFHAAPENEASEREDSSILRTSVPQVVDTSPGESYERRAYESSMASPAWPHVRQDSSYYHQQSYGASETYLRYSPDVQRNTYLNQNLFSQDVPMRVAPASASAHSGYRDYYQQNPQSMYRHSGRHGEMRMAHGDMRMPRAASLPLSRHGDPSQQHQSRRQSYHPSVPPQQLDHQEIQQIHSNVAQLRSARENSSRYHHSAAMRGNMPHPRSASMPHLHDPSTPVERRDMRQRQVHTGEEVTSGSYRSATGQVRPLSDPTTNRRRPFNPEHIEPAINDETSIVETSLHSLTESLDEDAISFITSMKYS